MKKKYILPEIEKINFYITNVICSSNVENFSSYIDGPGDWGDDPIIDPDEPIIW